MDHNFAVVQNPDPDAQPRRWQFRIDEVEKAFRLELGAGLGHYPIVDRLGKSIGLLLGFPIDLERELRVASSFRCQETLEGDPDRIIDSIYSSLGGRFIIILTIPGQERVYLNAGGQIPCVFDSSVRKAGATADSILSERDYHERFNHHLYKMLSVENAGWFPAGLTAHRGIHRLLPNHYLDLTSWKPVRHWPHRAEWPEASPDEVLNQLSNSVYRHFSALTLEDTQVVQAITAGRDARAILACARPFRERFELMTVTGGDSHSIDGRIAPQIAHIAGIQHRKIERVPASPDQRSDYLRRGGHSVADSNSHFFPSLEPLRGRCVLIGGDGGEVGRGFYWRQTDNELLGVTPELLARRCRFLADPAVLEAMEEWLGSLPTDEPFRILDLAYLELRLGCWAGPQFCCDPTLERVAPFVSRPSVEAMLAAPSNWKREDSLSERLIQREWPELLEIRFNSAGLIRDVIRKLDKVVRDPSSAWRKLRARR